MLDNKLVPIIRNPFTPAIVNRMWKRVRKTGLPCQVLESFKDDSGSDDDDDGCGAKKMKHSMPMIEDNEAASKRLTDQGMLFAENERYPYIHA